MAHGRLTRRGAVTVLVALALTVLALAAAFSFDIGRVVVAAHEAQKTAETAALAGAQGPADDPATATSRIERLVNANSAVSSFRYTQTADSPAFYGSDSTVPGFRTLGATERAVRVCVATDVLHFFAPIIGLHQTRVTRSAIAGRVTAGALAIMPIWISADTPLTEGQSTELHMSTLADSTSTTPIPPGNFGWLDPSPADFQTLLSGYQVPPGMAAASMVGVGDTVDGLTGQRVGQWAKTLGHSHDGLGRLDRAAEPPYDSQTCDDFTPDNPRLLLIPLVTVLSGSGGNATYRIERFAIFWLESVDSSGKSFSGRLVDGDVPSLPATPDGAYTGAWTVKLVG